MDEANDLNGYEHVKIDKIAIENGTTIRTTWFLMGTAVGVGLGWLSVSLYKKFKNRNAEESETELV
jgi:hypothetical protein